MANYDFRGLSDFDFENLVHDLLQKALAVRLEAFAKGRDQGIDLRYATTRGRTLIVQCKHYRAGSIAKLLRHLERDERPKVKRLNPDRYVLATSLSLTPLNKAQIVKVFRPYIKSTGDVFGADDLNALLRSSPQIERTHFKLFLTSSTQLSRMASQGTLTRTSFQLKDLEAKARLYVPGDGFVRAMRLLKLHRNCIVAGPPGTGKTTLASMVALYLSKKGYEPISLSEDIDEGDRLYDPDPTAKQVFFYDDFLGQTSSVDKLGKNEDARLLQFMNRVSNSKKKYFLLTTREYILQEARMRYERLDRSKQVDASRFILDLGAYSRLDRAQLLFNHIFFSSLKVDWKAALARSGVFWSVLDHQNFNPRLVESAIGLAQREATSGPDFIRMLSSTFDNPAELWLHPFERQLTPLARTILLSTATLWRDLTIPNARQVFDGFGDRRSVDDALRLLNGSFLVFDSIQSGKMNQSSPSIQDFLLSYLNRYPSLLTVVVQKAIFFEQLEYLQRLSASVDGAAKYPELVGWLRSVAFVLLERGRELLDAPPRSHAGTFVPDVDQVERIDCMLSLAAAAQVRPEWLSDLVRPVIEWSGPCPEVSTAADLLANARGLGFIDAAAVERAKVRLLDRVLDSCDSIDDFGGLVEMKHAFPALVTAHAKQIGAVVASVVEAEVDYLSDDIDSAGDARSRLEELEGFCARHGRELKDHERESIEERITRLDRRPSKADDVGWKAPAASPTDDDEAQIDAMFSIFDA